MKKIKEIASYILESIVGKENLEMIEVEEKDDFVVIKVKVKPDSIGKIIGREGKTVKALRSILRIVSFRETGKKLAVDIVKEE